jgi:hypothetical protein
VKKKERTERENMGLEFGSERRERKRDQGMREGNRKREKE